MTQTSPENVAVDCRVAFAMRPPSVAWETIAVPTAPPRLAWVWFKPANVPTGVVIQIPPGDPHGQAPLTLRMLLHALGIDPACVTFGSLFGYSFPGQSGTSLYFDQQLVAPAVGNDLSIVVCVEPPPSSQLPPAAPDAVSDGQLDELFRSIERDWKSSIQTEKQLTALHKQLMDMLIRLNSLNRDLTPEERLCSDREDRDDWDEARRWLREAATRLSRFIKECDVGETMYAGKKRWFEQIYHQCVVPRKPFDGLWQARSEFEVYRKTMQNLASSMQAAYQHASQEGERRAQQVLSFIASKVRAAKTR